MYIEQTPDDLNVGQTPHGLNVKQTSGDLYAEPTPNNSNVAEQRAKSSSSLSKCLLTQYSDESQNQMDTTELELKESLTFDIGKRTTTEIS